MYMSRSTFLLDCPKKIVDCRKINMNRSIDVHESTNIFTELPKKNTGLPKNKHESVNRRT